MSDEIKESEKIAKEIVDIMTGSESGTHESLDEWLQENRQAQKTISKLVDGDYLKQNVEGFHQKDKFILAEKLKVDLKSRKKRSLFVRLSVGVAALLAVSAVLYTVSEGDMMSEQRKNVISYNRTEQSTPIIVLSNGEVKDVTKMDHKSVELEDNQVNISDIKRVVKTDSLVAEERLNKFIVPNKYTGKLELCDGTIVHLNSNSELYFPTDFGGDIRRVELKGEGYFEVKRSDKMFVVSVEGVDVKVYGTKFNIRAYEKNVIETVLVDGLVGVNTKSGKEVRLMPNELCCVNKSNDDVSTQVVNVEKYITWINGKFMYERDPFVNLVKELSRWYGVDFVFLDKELKELSITAIFSKKSQLKDILETIEMLNLNIVFTQSEGRYYIKRN